MQYFVVMIDYGRRGREAVVDHETRSDFARGVQRIQEYQLHPRNLDSSVEDVTADILGEAALPDIATSEADLQAGDFDHARDLRKHETVS